MTSILAALIVAAAVLWAGWQLARALSGPRQNDSASTTLLALLAPAIVAAADDPKAILAWQPVAAVARQLYPKEFATLDQAFGSAFPFGPDQIERAHSRWTADWLAWERRHDAEFKLKAVLLEHELGTQLSSPQGRARLDAIEREKLDLYQHRYEEYTRVARALQALIRH